MKMPQHRPSMLFLDPQPVFHMRPGQLVHLTAAAVNNHNLKVRMGGDPFAKRTVLAGHLYRITQVMSSAELVNVATGEIAGWFQPKEMIYIRSYKGYTLKLKTVRQSYNANVQTDELLPWIVEYYEEGGNYPGLFRGWFYSPFGYAASFRGAAQAINDLIEAAADSAIYTYPDDSPSWGTTTGAPYSEDFQDWR